MRTIIATYAVVAVYCFVCARSYNGIDDNNLQMQQVRQLIVDSIAPTTITLVMTGIIQVFFTTASHERNFCHIFALIGMIVFTMLTAGCRPLEDRFDLISVIIGSAVIVVFDLGMLIEGRSVSDTRIGISGRKD